MLIKSRAVLELVDEIVDRADRANPGDRAFLEQALSGYVSAMVYSEVEKKVEAILSDRFGGIGDRKVSHFISQTYGKNQGRIKKSDIADLAKRFGEECKELFNSSVPDQYATYYSNLLTCRHNLAHGEPEATTLMTARQGIDAAELFLEKFELSIR
ncbi:HEPN domain-containing protein [Salipiger abyssi]|uniref:HEPN domain-containing protein n=1 Tax=Salipiger abyssi TaxID=1250539 RepID=UPI0012ECA92F|nr:HEPN domain-containing protein [Salipiger abyssi]